MSNLFKRYDRNLEDTGVSRGCISFLLFCFMWSLGVCCGVLLVVLGMSVRDLVSKEESELEKMIARMNEEGPNN